MYCFYIEIDRNGKYRRAAVHPAHCPLSLFKMAVNQLMSGVLWKLASSHLSVSCSLTDDYQLRCDLSCEQHAKNM